MAQRAMQKKNVQTDHVEIQETHKRVDIYEFQAMYKRGEIPIENMNEDQKYALIKLFENSIFLSEINSIFIQSSLLL